MPLRKQEELPKIPKTRKKSIDKAKSATPQEKIDNVDYVAKVFYMYDGTQQKQFYVLSLETVKEFTFLDYEISVDVRKSKETIDVSILGLNTRQTYFVQPKPAITELFFEDLFGVFTFNIIKQDGSINSGKFEFNVYKKEIKFLGAFIPEKKNNRLFCRFEIVEAKNTFLEE